MPAFRKEMNGLPDDGEDNAHGESLPAFYQLPGYCSEPLSLNARRDFLHVAKNTHTKH
jgi:hypothetical protein